MEFVVPPDDTVYCGDHCPDRQPPKVSDCFISLTASAGDLTVSNDSLVGSLPTPPKVGVTATPSAPDLTPELPKPPRAPLTRLQSMRAGVGDKDPDSARKEGESAATWLTRLGATVGSKRSIELLFSHHAENKGMSIGDGCFVCRIQSAEYGVYCLVGSTADPRLSIVFKQDGVVVRENKRPVELSNPNSLDRAIKEGIELGLASLQPAI